MAKSKISKDARDVIDRADKMVADMKKNTAGLLEALKKLRDNFSRDEGDEEEKSL